MPKVPQISIDAIFEKAAGHPVDPPDRIIVCGERQLQDPRKKKVIAGNLGGKKKQ